MGRTADARNPIFSKLLRHVDVKYQCTAENVQTGKIEYHHGPKNPVGVE